MTPPGVAWKVELSFADVLHLAAGAIPRHRSQLMNPIIVTASTQMELSLLIHGLSAVPCAGIATVAAAHG